MADRKFVYKNNVIMRPETEPVEAVQEALAEWFPELENAEYTQDEEGAVTFYVPAATKGADRKFIYKNNVIMRPASEPVEDVQEALAEWFPELENAEYSEDTEGTITFYVPAATKG